MGSVCVVQNFRLHNTGNVERHLRTLHSKIDNDFPPKSELGKQKVHLKTLLTTHRMFTRPAEKSIASTMASSHTFPLTAKGGIENGEMNRGLFWRLTILSDGFKNKTRNNICNTFSSVFDLQEMLKSWQSTCCN